MQMHLERWLPVVGFEDVYSVSTLGRVRRDLAVPGAVVGRILRPQVCSKYGHLMVHLSHHGELTPSLVHRLVLAAFVGPCPDGCETRHLNGKAGENHLENLSYGTSSENDADKLLHGTSNRGEAHNMAVLTRADVVEIKGLLARGRRQRAIAQMFGICQQQVSKIATGQRWGWLAEAAA